MVPFSKSSGVQADYSRDGTRTRKQKRKKTRRTPARSIMTILISILLMGSPIKQMIQDKSSYIRRSTVERVSVPSVASTVGITPNNNASTAVVSLGIAKNSWKRETKVESAIRKSQMRNVRKSIIHRGRRSSNNKVVDSAIQKNKPNMIVPPPRDVKSAFVNWTRPFWNYNNDSSTTFVFPDVDSRLRYYMGSWNDRSLETVDCRAFDKKFVDAKFKSSMHDKDILYSYEGLSRVLHSSKHWNTNNYLRYYHTVMRNASVPQNVVVAMCVGDSSSIQEHVPVAAKTRKAGFQDPTTSENNNNNTYFGIIWPLNMVRHYGPVHDYLALEQAGKVTSWQDKKEALIWRGGFTGVPNLLKGDGYRKSFHEYGPRVQAVLANCFKNQSQIDVAFVNIPSKENKLPASLNQTLFDHCIRQIHSSMEAQLEFKYILNVEGNDVSSGLKWQLASNSVVFMAKPRTVSWAMEDQLVPFYHYIPVDDNFENLDEMIDWAKTHDDQAKKIAEQSTQYMYDLWISEKAQREYAELHTLLATKYESQFAKALAKCLPSKQERILNLYGHSPSSATFFKRLKNLNNPRKIMKQKVQKRQQQRRRKKQQQQGRGK